MNKASPVSYRNGNQARLIRRPVDVSGKLQGLYNLKPSAAQTFLGCEAICGQVRRQSRLLQPLNSIPGSTVSLPTRVPNINKPANTEYKHNASGNGFSLLELLLAITIIGVLSAIAIPSYRGYLENNKVKTAISDIYYIQNCIERYYTETFSYPPTITEIASCLPNNGIDPWGKPYVYLNLIEENKLKGKDKPKGEDKGDDKKRRDHKENPINTLYDLYSKGKDGLSKAQLDNKESVDDVVLAHDGAFVGLSSDY
jgi:general secretion pathway protein G